MRTSRPGFEQGNPAVDTYGSGSYTLAMTARRRPDVRGHRRIEAVDVMAVVGDTLTAGRGIARVMRRLDPHPLTPFITAHRILPNADGRLRTAP
jgi:hypothetical protein